MRLYTPLCWFVFPSVGPSVTVCFLFLLSLASLLLPKWSSDLKYGPYPPARDWGSRVSGLVRHPKTNDTSFYSFLVLLCWKSSSRLLSRISWGNLDVQILEKKMEGQIHVSQIFFVEFFEWRNNLFFCQSAEKPSMKDSVLIVVENW